MGAWGAGLYSDDYALDLRSMVSAVCRLPLHGEELVGVLSDLDPAAALDTDEDHTTFWLVVADQLHRRGIGSSADVRALDIIDNGLDLQRCEALGMRPSDLGKRRRALEKLRVAIASAPPAKPRRTLKRPQPLLLQPGEVWVYPIDSQGNCVNPYFTAADRTLFAPVCWSAFVVLQSGLAFGYLAWYAISPSPITWRSAPTLGEASQDFEPSKSRLGTLSAAHASRINISRVGEIELQQGVTVSERSAVRTAAADISLANALSRWKKAGTYPDDATR